MDKRNIPGLILLVVSLGFLVPGLVFDLLTLEISQSVPLLGNVELYNETRSIMGTVQELFGNGNGFVGFLILFFSVIVPVLKGLAVLAAIFLPGLPQRQGIHRFVLLISKWSMADVFVVGVFIAFLSMKSIESVNAEIHSGFYFFLTYCVLSILGAQLIKIERDTVYEPVKPATE